MTTNSTQPIRTRFAPSPTGNLHIGGARTALFAYLAAKHTGGDFLLRIEDTDQTREVPGSKEVIYDGLQWLGMQWDEGPEVGGEFGPYIQSERLDIYAKYAIELVEKGKAYYDFRTAEELQALREEQQAAGKPPRYKHHQHDWSAEEVQRKLEAGEPYVIRMITPEEGTIVVEDIVRGRVEFNAKEVDDQVLLKSDGFPTYHLANVVDDHLMNINCVIRSEEWLPSAPKHVLLYQYFEWDAPAFAHLPVYLSKKGGKMSKRDGETSLLAFRDNGYLSEAVINFSVLLGWNPKTTEEFFTMEELIQRFTLEHVNKSGAIFETEKLDWMNQHYLRQLTTPDILRRIQEVASSINLQEEEKEEVNAQKKSLYERFYAWFTARTPDFQEAIMSSMKERSKTLLDIARSVEVIEQATPYDAADLVWKKGTKESTLAVYDALIQYLEAQDDSQFLRAHLEPHTIEWIKSTEWGNGDVLWPMRFALSGEQRSPSPFELAEMLGKQETLKRLHIAKEALSMA